MLRERGKPLPYIDGKTPTNVCLLQQRSQNSAHAGDAGAVVAVGEDRSDGLVVAHGAAVLHADAGVGVADLLPAGPEFVVLDRRRGKRLGRLSCVPVLPRPVPAVAVFSSVDDASAALLGDFHNAGFAKAVLVVYKGSIAIHDDICVLDQLT